MLDYKKMDEQTLLKLMQQENDQLAFSEIYNRFSHFLLTYAYKVTQNAADTQDIVQNIFVSIWNNRNKNKIEGPIINYLIRSVRFGFYKSIRKSNIFDSYKADIQRFIAYEYNPIEEYLVEKELIDKLKKIVEEFPENMGKVFIMTYFEGISADKIAEKLQISERTVHNLISQSGKRAKNGLGFKVLLLYCLSISSYSQCVIVFF